jgi:hypothetical protein
VKRNGDEFKKSIGKPYPAGIRAGKPGSGWKPAERARHTGVQMYPPDRALVSPPPAGIGRNGMRHDILESMRLVLLLLLAVPLSAADVVDHAWEILNRGLHDGNPAKRVHTVAAMGILRPQGKGVSMVESALTDKDYSVRQAACNSGRRWTIKRRKWYLRPPRRCTTSGIPPGGKC